MWVKAEAVPEALFPLWQSSFLFPSIHSPQSLTIFPSVMPPFILTAFHLHCLHLLKCSTSESHSTVWFLIWLFISIFWWHAPSTSLSLPLCLSPKCLSSSSCLLKKYPASTLFPFFFCFLSPPPCTPPALLQCLYRQFHSHCILLWLCWMVPPPISHGHTLYLCLCISVSLYSSLDPFLFLYTSPLLYPPFTLPPGAPCFFRHSEIQSCFKDFTAPLCRWSFLDLRGAGSRKLGQIVAGTGRRKYIFTLRLSQRHVIVE